MTTPGMVSTCERNCLGAGGLGKVHALDSKSSVRKDVWVQVPPPPVLEHADQHPPQFSLRWLFGVTGAIGLCLGINHYFGPSPLFVMFVVAAFFTMFRVELGWGQVDRNDAAQWNEGAETDP